MGKHEGKRPLGMSTDERMILKCILKKQNERAYTGLIWLMM
jgi:hypothetical protein